LLGIEIGFEFSHRLSGCLWALTGFSSDGTLAGVYQGETEVNTATFLLSTGRCGTQWIAANLQAAYGEAAVVEHEPLHDRYYPRLMLANGSPEQTGNAAEIFAHCETIEEILREKSYIECGWPAWGAMPYLLKRFEGRIKIVHLVRHPVPIACSWVSHRAFCPPAIPGLPYFREKILASPVDEGTAFPQYRETWEGMNPFEKSLFFWAEVNALGLKLEQTSAVPWRRIYFENLFKGNALPELMEFIGPDAAAEQTRALGNIKDEYRYVCDTWWKPQVIQKHPEIMRVAAKLGYEPLAFDEQKLRERYFPVY